MACQRPIFVRLFGVFDLTRAGHDMRMSGLRNICAFWGWIIKKSEQHRLKHLHLIKTVIPTTGRIGNSIHPPNINNWLAEWIRQPLVTSLIGSDATVPRLEIYMPNKRITMIWYLLPGSVPSPQRKMRATSRRRYANRYNVDKNNWPISSVYGWASESSKHQELWKQIHPVLGEFIWRLSPPSHGKSIRWVGVPSPRY